MPSKYRRQIDAAKDQPCADCGVQYPPYVMQLDHRAGSGKAFSVSDVLSGRGRRLGIVFTTEIVAAEIAKCEVVCANCHAIRTYNANVGQPTYDKRPGHHHARVERFGVDAADVEWDR